MSHAAAVSLKGITVRYITQMHFLAQKLCRKTGNIVGWRARRKNQSLQLRLCPVRKKNIIGKPRVETSI